MSEPLVYLDYAGACPVLPEIVAAHGDLCRRYVANPHASSRYSEAAKRAIMIAERELLDALEIPPEVAQVIWTSGGTEAANLATLGVLRQTPGALALVDAGAHPALAEPCRQYARREGGRCVEIPLNATADLDLERLRSESTVPAALVAVTHVNNETGAVADLARVRGWMQEHAPRALLVVDAAQSFGKHCISWQAAALDALVVSARKIGGPASVGALVIRRGLCLEPLLYGGGQQGNARSGTLDVVGVIEAGQAARLVAAGREAEAARIAALNTLLRQALAAWSRPALRLLSPPRASPWILTFAVPGSEGAVLMRLLAERRVLVATGSACSAESGKTSHVLRAMGVPDVLARAVLRVSIGRQTTAAHLETFLGELRQVIDAY
jgi:cysteine desulfurase